MDLPPDALVVLDTSVLLRVPEVLAIKPDKVVFVVPKGVERELAIRVGRRQDLRSVANLIKQARSAGVLTPIAVVPDTSSAPISRYKLSSVDVEVFDTVEHLRNAEGARVVLATEDRALAAAFREVGGRTIGASELRRALQGPTTPNTGLQKQADAVQRKLGAYLNSNLVVGIVVTGSGVVAWISLPFLLRVAPLSVPFIIAAVGVGLFQIRSRFRLGYGLAEMLVGIGMAYLTAKKGYFVYGLELASGLQLLAGLYVIVRGLDNVGKGVTKTRFESHVKWLLPD